jgi:DNA polymerase-1
MTNRRYIFDIEADHLVVEATQIWLAVAIDADTGEVHTFNRDQLGAFGELLVGANELIGHNIIGYDVPVCERLLGIKITATLTDTLILSRMMYPDRFNKNNPIKSHSLSAWGDALGEPKTDFKGEMIALVHERHGMKFTKEEGQELSLWGKRGGFSGPPPFGYVSEGEWLTAMGSYCKQDVVVNDKVYRKQYKFLIDNAKPYALETLASTICAEMVLNGWGFDADQGEIVEQNLMMDKADALDRLRIAFPTIVNERYSDKQVDKVTGQPKRLKDEVIEFNPGSAMHVANRLTDKYGWKPDKTETGMPQCDTESLMKIANRMPEAKLVIEYRDIAKLEGQVKSWNELAHVNLERSGSSRVHGQINVQGTVTGRCTHSGPNMAQVAGDHRARSLWVPTTPGHVILGADLSGLELRMLAHYMHQWDEGAYADLILNGDIHWANAQAAGLAKQGETFDKDNPDHGRQRGLAKTFIYAFLYGAGDQKIGQCVGGGRAAGAKLKAEFLDSLPALKRLIDDVGFEAMRFKSVELPDTRRVPVRSEHAALNTLLQGAGAIVSKYWMIVANKNLKAKYGSNVVQQMAYVHDEIQYSCPPDIAEEAGQIVIDAAVEAGDRLKISMRVDAAYDIGTSWADTH